MKLIALLLLALLSPPDPRLTAKWDSDHSASVQFTSAGRACLSVRHATGQGVFLGCYDKVGTIVLAFGGSETDAAYRPSAHDVYILVSNGQTYRAALIGRAQYLAAFY